MNWNTLLDIHATQPEKGCDEERLLAQAFVVRLLEYFGSSQAMGHRDWEQLSGWLGVPGDRVDFMTDEAGAARFICQNWKATVPIRKGPVSAPLLTLCERLRGVLGLNEVERDILALTWLKLRHEPLQDLFDGLAVGDQAQQVALLVDLIGHPTAGVALAMRPGSALIGYGLLEAPYHHVLRCNLLSAGSMLFRISPLLLDADDVYIDEVLDEVMRQLCPRQPASRWTLGDFPQVTSRQLLVDYLRRAIGEGRQGANVLIHGVPGVGKTELARTLAGTLGVSLFGVPSQHDTQLPMPPADRLSRYRIAQRLVASRTSSLVLFDEVEDILAGGVFMPKAWTNQLLEENPVPSLWLCNDVSWIDPAFLRRFDLIIEIKTNATSHHRQALRRQLDQLPILPEARAALAQQPWMTPALASQLDDLAALLPSDRPLRSQQRLHGLLAERLAVMGQPVDSLDEVFGIAKSGQTDAPHMPAYRLDWLNTDPSLHHLVKRLKRRGKGRLCLHGPPGCGKTALARHLAEVLECPLIMVSASSLLDRFVGGTERQIDELFRRADDQQAVLLIDEIDSLLMARDNASQSWEVSHTNALLTALDAFGGILLATTNRVDSLDLAVMRRFDLKVAFYYLAIDQLRDLLRAVLPGRDHARLETISQGELAQRALTPGNIRTALDRLDLQGLPIRLATLLQALTLEEGHQQGDKLHRSIGFTAKL
ncbi:AAA family ATPase [Halomonas ventosae]|uniref:SpoVK/Ycf46/Vps4 family AAA+-type ATPase n=1 Tax=Halomonas ventosae TaxID=229007 RepID=A0A2T0VRS1_9GAMM|nr:AAA family ATPase [Halomonas ventosae]PRY73213.1 SpoVK/Ycf46/Vps4 family AAA+-type ATPase [Halomonas ventosae]